MPYIIAILVAFGLLAGFFLLTKFERAHNMRVLGNARRALDTRAASVAFITRNVNLSAFVKDMIRSGATHIVHDIAHGALVVVRGIERALTGMVRTLRHRRDRDAERPSPLARAASYAAHAFRSKKVDVLPSSQTEHTPE